MIELVTHPTEHGTEVVEMCLGICIYKRTHSGLSFRRAVRKLIREPRSAKFLMAAAVLRDHGDIAREKDALARAALALATEIREQGRVR